MESEIKSAFDYLNSNPGGLTPGERQTIKELQEYFQKYKTLTESQRMTLFEVKKHREKMDSHLY